MHHNQLLHTPVVQCTLTVGANGTLSLSHLCQVFSESNKENNEYTLFLFCIPFLPPASFFCLAFFFFSWLGTISGIHYNPFCTLQALHLLSPTHSHGARLPSLFFFLGGGQIVQLEVGKGGRNRNQASKENRARKEFTGRPVEKAWRRQERFYFPLIL